MIDNLVIAFLGICIVVIGILNCLGRIETIHRYNRSKITEETKKPYGMTVGIGTVIIGLSMSVCFILQLILETELVFWGLLVGVAIGVALMLYAQFKYNGGIF